MVGIGNAHAYWISRAQTTGTFIRSTSAAGWGAAGGLIENHGKYLSRWTNWSFKYWRMESEQAHFVISVDMLAVLSQKFPSC